MTELIKYLKKAHSGSKIRVQIINNARKSQKNITAVIQ